MSLREISLRTSYEHPRQLEFNKETWCIREMYWYPIKDLYTGRIQKIVISLYEASERIAPIEINGDVIKIQNIFEFDQYFKCSKYEKKKRLLDIIHSNVMLLSEQMNWDQQPLINSYQDCLSRNLFYNGFLKNKFIKSPDGNCFAAIYFEWDFEKIDLYVSILNRRKVEIARELIVTKEPQFGDFIYWLKWRWDTINTVEIISQDGQKWKSFLPPQDLVSDTSAGKT